MKATLTSMPLTEADLIEHLVIKAKDNLLSGARPFAALLLKDGEIIAQGVNRVAADCDPSAHAEMQAIRAAAKSLETTQLDGAVLYASGHPCPMCLAAALMAGIREIHYVFDNHDAEFWGFSSEASYGLLGLESQKLAQSPGFTIRRCQSSFEPAWLYGALAHDAQANPTGDSEEQ
ncbi:nucleoside deaminase [Shewanella algae]|uniref:nucleoside deaminase n=1 Tax=Shewanella algae TaxID=38313 RepID=UPI001AADD0FB|nr:nucleoside deaminase [Shewanella algae]MBO2551198.1 nucleoside deaminase [Shewanella algae]